jgi:cytochrome P450
MLFNDFLSDLQSTLKRMNADAHVVIHELEEDTTAFLDNLKQHALNNPGPIFAILRQLRPVLVIKSYAVVTLFADVQEVLLRDDVFGVNYGPKMRVVTGGQDFFLGMPDSPDFERDLSHMRTVIRRSDLPVLIAPFVATTAHEIVEQAKGRLELVSQLTLPVPVRLLGNYFGCPIDSEPELAAWASTIFQYLFLDFDNDPAIEAAAKAASAGVRVWLDRSIALEKVTPTQQDTVIRRCLALQQMAGVPGMDDRSIRDNLLGIFVGAIPTTSKCCAQVMDELLKRPDMLAGAQQAALANDDTTLAKYVFEALRFQPNSSGVIRVALQDYTIGNGTSHATHIPAGTTLLVATQSAMFDESVLEMPWEFRIDRQPYNYLHWSAGLHSCFGQYINQVQLPAILKPLLQRSNLRRAEGSSGTMNMDGPFPASLWVKFA